MMGPEPEEPPPVLGHWHRIYMLVLGALLACILGFAWFSKVYR